MSPIKKRLTELEAKRPVVVAACHRIIVEPDATVEAAVSDYGTERIAAHDRLIIRKMVDAPNIPRSPARLEIVR